MRINILNAYSFIITEQEKYFYTVNFTASNKIKIKSINCPQWDFYSNTLYLRGDDKEDDDKDVTNSKEGIGKMLIALDELHTSTHKRLIAEF